VVTALLAPDCSVWIGQSEGGFYNKQFSEAKIISLFIFYVADVNDLDRTRG